MPAKANWAYPGIFYCVTHDLMNGSSDTAFHPKHDFVR